MKVAFPTHVNALLSHFIECFSCGFPCCSRVTVPLLCDEILDRFLNFPFNFGLRYSQLLCKTQSSSLYRIGLKQCRA